MFQPATPSATHDPRRAAILQAAFEVFCRYGFRRTSMEDIARAADLSRAALYLHFANKQDIHRSLIGHYFAVTEDRARAALKPGLPPEAALEGFFNAKAGPELEAMFASPHGQELIDANATTSADLVQEGEARIAALLADWLQAEAAAGRITLPGEARTLAGAITGALAGIKSPRAGIAAFRADARHLAALLGRGMRPEIAQPGPDRML